MDVGFGLAQNVGQKNVEVKEVKLYLKDSDGLRTDSFIQYSKARFQRVLKSVTRLSYVIHHSASIQSI